MNKEIQELRGQVFDIVMQPGIPASKKLAQVRGLFDIPAPKRGRKPKWGDPLNFCPDYQKARRTRLYELKRCNACGQPNARHPKTRCQACADKYSQPAKRAAMNKSIEA